MVKLRINGEIVRCSGIWHGETHGEIMLLRGACHSALSDVDAVYLGVRSEDEVEFDIYSVAPALVIP